MEKSEIYITADPILYSVLHENAKIMRQYPTPAEAALWALVRQRQLDVVIRRQYVIDQYIADFVCLEKQLIIELDGKYHFVPGQIADDRLREQRLARLGFRIIRFTNDEMLVTPEIVIQRIKSALNEKNEIKQI